MQDRRRISNAGTALTGVLAACFATEGWAAIEEIVVTVRKREETLQSVPIAVTALTEQQINKLNISDLADVSRLSSSVIFDQGFSSQDTRITIRGLAPTRGRQNVAVLVDDIDIASQANLTNGGGLLINPRLFDLERIEIVKGPQNALYGRTAFAGAINYVTKQPGDQLEGSVGTDIGNNGQLEFRGGLSGPLIADTLSGGINVASWNHDGFYRNSVTGGKIGDSEGWGVSGQLVWNATDKIQVRYRTELISDEFGQSPYTALVPTVQVPIPTSALGTVISPALTSIESVVRIPNGKELRPTLSENPRTGSDYPGVDRDIWRNSLTIDFDLGPVLLKSLSHYADSEVFSFEDSRREGSASANFVAAEFWLKDKNKLLSQELRLQSNAEGPLQWTVGGLLWREDNTFFDGSFNCVQTPGFVPPATVIPGRPCGPDILAVVPDDTSRQIDPWERDTRHWSVYGLVEWEFLENFRVIAEARYTDEKLELSGPDRPNNSFFRAFNVSNPLPPPPGGFPPSLQAAVGTISAADKDSFFLPKATLQWLPSDSQMYYASWAKAAKPSGIATVAALQGFLPDTNRFETEKLQVWELGGKTSWLDNRLVLNGSLFYQDFSDKQTTSQFVTDNGILLTRPVNASKAEIYGLELDVLWRVLDELTLRASYTWLDAKYKRFTQLNSGASRIADAGNCTPVPLDPVPAPPTNPLTCEINLSGKRLEFTPRNAAVLGFDYERALAGGTSWFLESDVVYQGKRFLNDSNSLALDSYSEVGFRLGLRSEQWEVLAYAENAFDDDTVRSSFANTYNLGLRVVPAPAPFTFVLPLNQTPILPDGRQVGLRVNYRFSAASR
jgi:outer membrane receptor protein involved in Fe transport